VAVGVGFDDGEEVSVAGEGTKGADVSSDQVEVDFGPDAEASLKRGFTGRGDVI
jgi:hypothetical protein